MARPKLPAALSMTGASMVQVSGNPVTGVPQGTVQAAASVFKNNKPMNKNDDRNMLAQRWQIECYRQVNICGEARYAVTLFGALAARADIGVSEPQTLTRKAVWVDSGPEVEAFAEVAPTVRDRSKLIQDYMIHRSIAGECYLIARERRENDPEFDTKPDVPIWEIVAVTELQKTNNTADGQSIWRVRYDNENWVNLHPLDPVIRMWNPDPEKRREAWSPMKSLLPVLKEIEWYTGHIFTQIRSRLMLGGMWFLPENMTYPAPPPEAINGGAEAMAHMNEAELFMAAIAASASYELDLDEVSLPTIIMADAAALESIDQSKLIKFWSEIDSKAMEGRSDAIRRFALGFDLPPEQILGSSGVAVSGSGTGGGNVNHWGEWAVEEKTIAGHIDPALNDFTYVLTVSVLCPAVPGTNKVIAYDPASVRMKQDRSKEALELNARGLLKGAVTVREVGFDPDHDMMDDQELARWVLVNMVKGSWAPEQMNVAAQLLGVALPDFSASQLGPAKGTEGQKQPPNLDDHQVKGPPEGDHMHQPAPYALAVPAFSNMHASAEALVLRALEKAGNRLLNDGKRGRDRDRTTPPHLAHLAAEVEIVPDFDFTLLPTVLGDLSVVRQVKIEGALSRYCARMYLDGDAYTREGLIEALEGL